MDFYYHHMITETIYHLREIVILIQQHIRLIIFHMDFKLDMSGGKIYQHLIQFLIIITVNTGRYIQQVVLGM